MQLSETRNPQMCRSCAETNPFETAPCGCGVCRDCLHEVHEDTLVGVYAEELTEEEEEANGPYIKVTLCHSCMWMECNSGCF